MWVRVLASAQGWFVCQKSPPINYPPPNFFWVLNGSWKELPVREPSGTFIVILTFLKIWKKMFKLFCNIKVAVVNRPDIDTVTEEHADEEDLMTETWRMLNSSSHLTNAILITPLFFSSGTGPCIPKIHCFVQYTPKTVLAVLYSLPWRQDSEEVKTQKSVFGTTMSCSYAYKVKDHRRLTVSIFFILQKTHSSINRRMVELLNLNAEERWGVELVKKSIKHREPIDVRFILLQYAKFRLSGNSTTISSIPWFVATTILRFWNWIPTTFVYLCQMRT